WPTTDGATHIPPCAQLSPNEHWASSTQNPLRGLSATHIMVCLSQNAVSTQAAASHDSPTLARPGGSLPTHSPVQHAMPQLSGASHRFEAHSVSRAQDSPS